MVWFSLIFQLVVFPESVLARDSRDERFDAFEHFAECPTSPQDWLKKREQFATLFDESADLESAFKKCRKIRKSDFNAYPLDQCFERIWKFRSVNKLGPNSNSYRLGLSISDLEYERIFLRKFAPPPELVDPQFLKEISNPETFDQAVERIKSDQSRLPAERRMRIARFQSHITSLNGTGLGRVLFYVPGEPKRFVQFVPPGKDTASPPSQMSMVVVEDNKDGKPPVTWFMDYWRVYSGDRKNIHISTRRKESMGGERCFDCHSSGPIPVHVDSTQIDARDLKEVSAINEAMQMSSIAYREESPYRGPVYGSTELAIKASRSDASLSSIPALGHQGVDLKNIRYSMECADCHNGRVRMPLYWGTKLTTYITSYKTMPDPDERTLSEEERTFLLRALYDEMDGNSNRPGLLRNWFLQESCGIVPTETPVGTGGKNVGN